MDKISFICLECERKTQTDDEDDVTIGLCKNCQYGFDLNDEPVEESEYRICNCEDYPCCGH